MRAGNGRMLLLMLSLISCAAAAATAGKDPKCEGVNKNLLKEDLHKIFGDWVLVWSATDDPKKWDTYNASSSQLRLLLHSDNKTIVYEERNRLSNSSCHVYAIKLLADHSDTERHALKTSTATLDYDGYVMSYEDAGHVYLYESASPNDLVLVYNGEEGRFLLIYRRKGHHTGDELKSHHKQHQDQAACLGFPVDGPFIYDGVSEFCHECDRMKKNLPREDLPKIFGDWVLVWSATDDPKKWDTYNASSSQLRLLLHSDNKTIVYEERNRLSNSSCHVYASKLLADHSDTERHALKISTATVDYDGYVMSYEGAGHVYLYESASPNDLVLVYNGEEGRFLLIYRRKGHHTGDELKSHHKQHQDQAACLGFPVDGPFIYDGVSEFCHECDRMKKNLPREDLPKIFGHWVMVWTSLAWDFFNFKSSLLHLYLDPDNRTVVYYERNLLTNSSCHIWNISLLPDPAIAERLVLNITSTTVDYNGHVEPIAETGHAELYESDSPDDLVLVYTNQEGAFLQLYRRKGLLDPKLRAGWERRAVCMGFPVDQPFVYDGVTPFCDTKNETQINQ